MSRYRDSEVSPEVEPDIELNALQAWFNEVLQNDNPRDRMAVTGQRLTRGTFGRIALHDCAGRAELKAPPGKASNDE